jgi:putative sterol carrier protein
MLRPADFFDARPSIEKLKALLPEGAVVAVHIEGEDGGSWQLEQTGRVHRVKIGPKDCEIRCTAGDFMAIVGGTLTTREAFLSGRLRIEGDIGLALRLQDLVAA